MSHKIEILQEISFLLANIRRIQEAESSVELKSMYQKAHNHLCNIVELKEEEIKDNEQSRTNR